jgi:hypothetical protein
MKKELKLFTIKKILLALTIIAMIGTIVFAVLAIKTIAFIGGLTTYVLIIAWQSVDKQYRYTKLQRRIMETVEKQMGKIVRIEVEKGLGKTKNLKK